MIRLVVCLMLVMAVPCLGEDRTAGEVPEKPLTDADRDHWAFRDLHRPAVPTVKQNEWCGNPIDHFILSKIESRRLSPMPTASRHHLLRRVTYDLTGLPPTPEQIESFLHDDSPHAYELLVDRLLASPSYGERQAQFWLDLARYAETDGFEHDKLRPQAWRYRDWVIEAFNEDLPLNDFIRWQVAGDLLEPDNTSAVIATGFLLAGPDMPDINLQSERRHNFLNEMTSTVGSTFLGLQLGCAQCHHHKFDPISQHDFYRLRACFDSANLFKDHPLPGVKQTARVMKSEAKPVTSHLWIRGDFRRRGSTVTPGTPRIAPISSLTVQRSDDLHPRAYLAHWLSSDKNALVTRVMVNRIWQQHFGTGLSRSPSDFGIMGDEPEHLELLDWLATEFTRQNWSLKRLHRLIVLSSTYQQASAPFSDEQLVKQQFERSRTADPENRLFSRQNRRRLEGEAIRDAMLQVSQLLNQRRGGPGVRPPLPSELVSTLLKNQWTVSPDREDHFRRSIYVFARRNLNYPLFGVFDQPSRSLSCARRVTSTTAPQALALLNSQLTQDCADALQSKLVTLFANEDDRIRHLYLLILNRPATEGEVKTARDWLRQPDGDWITFCIALLNLNEFLYVD